MPHRLVRTIALTLALLGSVFVASPPAQSGKAPSKADEAKLRDKEKAKAERDARRYDKFKAFAQNLYATDPDFRDEVDDHFDQVQRGHSIEAYEKNVSPPARPTVVHDGDRLRLQTGLYDNKIVADYINRVGQRLVPLDSDKLFAFRLVAHPIPFAETLSTGTIYVSTGLVSLLDNEAQLAYVLGHEMAHVQLDHWKLKSMLTLAQDDFERKEGAKRRWWGIGIGAAVGIAAGAASGANAAGVTQAAASGAAVGLALGTAWNSALSLDWDTVQENEADDAAFKATLRQNYDVREVPKLYVTLQQAVRQDQRVGLAFIGNRRRTTERLANSEDMVGRTLKAEIESKQASLVATQPEFVRVISTLKRDNGVLSFYHDMFQLAKKNLEYARTNRPNDPSAHYYYGKVMKLVGRTEADRKLADEAFQKAIDFDHRGRNYGAHFYRALAMIEQKNTGLNNDIAKELQAYLLASMRFASEEAAVANALPANIDDMYDYLTEVGEVKWKPTIPDSLKVPLVQIGTDNQRPDSVLKGVPVGTKSTTQSPGKTPAPGKAVPVIKELLPGKTPAPPKQNSGGGDR